jgi:hypothetical protein
MGRAIIPPSTVAPAVATRSGPGEDFAPAPAAGDSYSQRLIKLIPTEVIGVYLSMLALLGGAGAEPRPVLVSWVVFAFGVFATWFYLRVTLKVLDRRQLALSVTAFCIWAFSIGEPFSRLDWYDPTYAGLLMIAYTFIAPQIPMGGVQARA